MKKVLITGANGQLGSEIKKISSQYKLDFIFTDINELDITDKINLEKFFSFSQINYLVNCAAYTAVDKAEGEKDKALLINSKAPKYLAEYSNQYGFKLIHISTDYVFNGAKNTPYLETDSVDPLNHYGVTKLKGEIEIQNICQKYIIFRTSWLYSSFGNNFVKTILKLAKEKDSLQVVVDQIGTPTYAKDLAIAICEIIQDYNFEKINGLFHFSNLGVASWYDFAHYILKKARINKKIIPILSQDYQTRAKRPIYSVLSKTKFEKYFNIAIRHWSDALDECLNLLI